MGFSVFVFDTESGELLRNGRPLRIPDQAARLLAVLVENPGVVLTRNDLRSRLWPEGEALDYDQSINRAISQLRAILRDRSSRSAQFIDTFPKRGYRFTATVTTIRPLESIDHIGPLSEGGESGPLLASASEIDLPTMIGSGSLQSTPGTGVVSGDSPLASSPARPHSAILLRSRALWGLVAALTLGLIGATLWGFAQRRHPNPAHPLSLGMVPFEVSGEDAGPLADSFRLDLADSLSQVPTIEIRAAHSFDDLGQDEEKIEARAQKLGIDALLFGKFAVSGDQCQLRFELVRSRDGVHLLSLQYSGRKEELGTIRDRIDGDIFQRLLLSNRAAPFVLPRTSSPAAYAAYLRGRSYLAHWTDDSLALAIQSFQDALKAEPGYARADAGISSSYFILSQHGVGDRNASLERSREFANRALALDPSLAEAHAMLGQVALVKDWNFTQANEQLHRATDLDPSHAVYHQWLSILYCTEARYGPALQEIDSAHAADPDWAPPYMTEIYVADSAGQFDRSDRAVDALLKKMPAWSLAHEQNAIHLWASRRYPQAIDEWHYAAVLEKNADRASLEQKGVEAFRTGGVAGYARLRLQAIAAHKGISHEEVDFVPAEWHAYAGDWDQVLDELDALVKGRSTEALQIGTNPAYLPLHHDPRFLALLKSVGLPVPSDPPARGLQAKLF